MREIAVLLACRNRKVKTLACLESLYTATEYFSEFLNITVYLTDDFSTDGTVEAVAENFPSINIIIGDGNLYWAGGMRVSWKEALHKEYDGYLLLNDDTLLFNSLFENILATHSYCINNYKKGGIYIGSTKSPIDNSLTYGGSILTNRFLLKYKKLYPSGNYQECDLGNANIMYVTKEVVKSIGILSDNYKHGIADYDYTLLAKKNKIPVLIMPEYCGVCENDHGNKIELFLNKNIKQRINYLKSPIGLAFSDNLIFMKRNFPYRLPFVFLSGIFKVLFPLVYSSLRKA